MKLGEQAKIKPIRGKVVSRKRGVAPGERPAGRLKLSDIQVLLPEAGQAWLLEISTAERHCTQIILTNVGVESLLEHWKEYRDELKEIQPALPNPIGFCGAP